MDEAAIAELVFDALDFAVSRPEVVSEWQGDVSSVDWNDLGEVTIVTVAGTFRGTFIKLGDDE